MFPNQFGGNMGGQNTQFNQKGGNYINTGMGGLINQGGNYNMGNNMNPYGMNTMNNMNLGGNQNMGNLISDKEKHIVQLKNIFPNMQHKSIQSGGALLDLVDLVLPLKAPGVNLQIPIALSIDAQYPQNPPKIYIRSKLKHNLFDVSDQIIELKVSNFMQWGNGSTLNDLMSYLKALFEKDPPKQEKIIEDVNNLLSQVTEQNFRDVVTADKFSQRTYEELKALQTASFQELICSSGEYKKIAQNLLDVISFNEKTASEVIAKKENLEQQKQTLNLVADRIKDLMNQYNQKVEKCNKFKDAFSKQNIQEFVDKEIKKLDTQTAEIEANASQQYISNPIDLMQIYFDTRKKCHNLQIIRAKLPGLKYN